jgi:hypothetical protein
LNPRPSSAAPTIGRRSTIRSSNRSKCSTR